MMLSMRKKVFIFIALLTVAFIAGIIFAPFLQESTYQLKEWVGRTISYPPLTKVATFYFATPEEQFLVPVKRKIPVEEEVNSQIKTILQELIKGPQGTSFVPTLPPETKIRATYTKENIIYVDFSSSLKKNHPGGTSGELVSIYSIVNTLLENFPSYSWVQILIEGEPHQTLVGHIDIRGPFAKNNDIIKNQ